MEHWNFILLRFCAVVGGLQCVLLSSIGNYLIRLNDDTKAFSLG